MTEELTPEQIEAIESLLERRMTNTGETRAQASNHIRSMLLARLSKIETHTGNNNDQLDSGTAERCTCCSSPIHAE
jgi:hypothetical protein